VIALFKIDFAECWDEFFVKLDKSEKDRLWKRIQKLAAFLKARHLKHGLPFFVVETGQYRICFEETKGIRRIMFAGNHKQYEKWYEKQ